MALHQIQLRYDATADRLLMQLRTTEAEHYGVWLTRRMVSRLYPPFRAAVTTLGVAQTAPQALPVPEARQMLEQAALQRPLQNTHFEQPFSTADASHPLGPEPLLADSADLRPGAGGQLVLALRETRGRRVEVTLTTELALALLRLWDAALGASEWALPLLPAAPMAETSASPASAAGTGPLLS